MTTYAAFIRGIMPMNPNMRNAKLCGVFESLGFTDVKAVISSGNIVFKSGSKSSTALEAKIQKALSSELGFPGDTFVRSKEALQKMIKRDPFKGAEHNRTTYLIISFLKQAPHEVFATFDLTAERTPEFMKDIETKYGKVVTTRTWKTVRRIFEKME
jgi:uncharacterized protein (DUF1697 family)